MFRAGRPMLNTLVFSRTKRTKRLECYMSKATDTNVEAETRKPGDYGSWKTKCDSEKGMVLSSYWMPDARTGIYVPEGHERVIEDIPENAATFKQTYWLRSDEGVDHKPQPDYLF